jgi:alkylation response protein AidB-like acyl-CoA dehydrogenase
MLYDIDRSDDTTAVVDLGRTLAANLLDPVGAEVDRTGQIPTRVVDALFETGLIAPVNETLGGGGVPTVAAQLQFVEALAHGDVTCAAAAVWAGAAAHVLGRLDEPAANDLLRSVAKDAASAELLMFEGFGRSPSDYQTSTTSRVAGTKYSMTGTVTAAASVIVGHDGVGIVQAIGSNRRTTPSARSMGLHGLTMSIVDFDVVPDHHIAMSDQMLLGLCHVRLLNAALLLGCAQRATEYAASYANERIAFGKPISSFQGVSFMLAEAALRIGAAHLDMIDVAWQIDANDVTALEARTTRALNYAGAVAMSATRDAVQVLGGHGFITDHPVERWYRAAATIASLDCDPLCSPFEAAL